MIALTAQEQINMNALAHRRELLLKKLQNNTTYVGANVDYEEFQAIKWVMNIVNNARAMDNKDLFASTLQRQREAAKAAALAVT